MAGIRNYEFKKRDILLRDYVTESHFENSNNSGRHPLTGELVLTPQAYNLDHRILTNIAYNATTNRKVFGANLVDATRVTNVPVETSSCDNKAIAKFYSQLSQGRAGLGITLAQFGQTRGMVLDRFRKIDRMFANVERRRRSGRRKPITVKTAASDVLEYEFGWVPLVSEIYALSAHAFALAIPPIKVTGRSSERFSETLFQGGSPSYQDIVEGRRSCCVDAFVSIENPNLWLADRLGVINPAVVAWDAVPWSFVVNFFSNTNAYMSQFTNLIGLRIRNISTTRSCRTMRYTKLTNTRSLGWYDANMLRKYKRRTVGTIPTVEWQLRVPSMDWETAIIASSLLVQRLRKLP